MRSLLALFGGLLLGVLAGLSAAAVIFAVVWLGVESYWRLVD